MGKLNVFLDLAEEYPYKTAAILLLFHLLISTIMFSIACSPYFTGMHNGHGLWNFAVDSFGYDQRAIRGALMLQAGDISAWWAGDITSQVQYPHVRLIALMYFLFGSSPLAFAPINALTWVATVFAAYALARLLVPDNRSLALLGAAIFSLMPTYLLQTTQLLKDPLYTFGICSLFLVLVRFLNGMFSWKWLLFGLLGFNLCIVIRPYIQMPIASMIYIAFTITFFLYSEYRKQIIIAASVFFVLLYADPFEIRNPHGHAETALDYSRATNNALTSSQNNGTSSKNNGTSSQNNGTSSQNNGTSSQNNSFSYSPVNPDSEFYKVFSFLDHLASSFQRLRYGMHTYNAGSHIDEGVVFDSWTDALRYFPRAFQVALFSPFPPDWFKPAQSAGKGARLLAGAEMILLYVLWAGFAAFVFCKSVPLRLRAFLVIFSLSFLLLLGMAIPNAGAIFRMRYPYLLPIILGGVYGCWLILNSGQYSVFGKQDGRQE